MEILGLNIERLGHDTFKIKGKEIIIYTDPYQIKEAEPADLILISHEHFDHCDPPSVEAISKEDAEIVGSPGAVKKLGRGKALAPGEETEVKGIKIKAVKAYNVNKFKAPGVPFHSPEENMCGFVFVVDGVKLYHAGDTDNIPEMKGLEREGIDIAMLPISGVYVMTEQEAAEAVKAIKPKIVVPMHYQTKFPDGVELGGDTGKFKQLVGVIAEVIVVE